MKEPLLTRVFLRLNGFPSFRRAAWKLIYESLARRLRYSDWKFMNYGFAPLDGRKPLRLDEKDESNRYSIQHYHELATRAEIANKDVLEVGSGRGGGAAYVKHYLMPRRMVGMDVAPTAVRLANTWHGTAGLKYVRGSAEAMPLRDSSFDVVLNVESCHAYGSVPRFLSEVQRVLRPGGSFLCTDIRSVDGMQQMRQHVGECGMELREISDITPNVLAAMELDDAGKRALMHGRIPRWIRAAFEDFVGLPGSSVFRDLTSGASVYHTFVLQKSG